MTRRPPEPGHSPEPVRRAGSARPAGSAVQPCLENASLPPHAEATDRLVERLRVDPATGLSTEEAARRLRAFGENRLQGRKGKSLFRRFLDQLLNVMILILLLAATISFGMSVVEHDPSGLYEGLLILLIVLLNAVLGVLQESRAEKALEALRKMAAPRARVLRDGRESIVDAAALVPGDLLLLEAGDLVPADARLLESASLRSEESALTGESVPVEKDARARVDAGATIGDRLNMVHAGCSITYGRGRAAVAATGQATEMGRIANLLESEIEGATPLQQRLADLGKKLGYLALAACAVIFAIGIVDGIPVLEIFMTSVSLAVSAIPEGLPAIVTIVLSIGVQRMVRRNAIIRRLPAVETLGSASVICSDKTGTLTQNRMTLVKAYTASDGAVEDIADDNSPAVRDLLLYGALCSDAAVEPADDGFRLLGDPTESAIVLAALANGLDRKDLVLAYPRLAEIPFESERKRMTTVHAMDGRIVAIVKGAYDVLADRCSAGHPEAAAGVADRLGRDAIRILAVATRELDAVPDHPTAEDLERDLTFRGLLGMIDPPRPEARDAVAVCRDAGIRPVMITGDHVATASAIARDLGILAPGDTAVTGSELAQLDDGQLEARVRSISVYARVSPEDKIRIVRAWQHQGEIVAMTGDGVNDAPALKAADIGCAMGITGTDVAKGASDMILTDDNFATIVEAVREGRSIYDNIRKAVAFLLGTNIGEVLSVFVAVLLWRKSPLLAMQLLWINLVTDSLPAIALGMEAVEPGVMRRPPKPKRESLFAHGLGLRVGLQGALFALLTLAAFRIGLGDGNDLAAGRTMAFLVLALSQVAHAYNMRSDRSLFALGPFTNRRLNLAALAALALMALVAFVPPLVTAFGLSSLPALQYLAALGLALVPIPVLELSKALGLHGGRSI